jgi:hypothetical protein
LTTETWTDADNLGEFEKATITHVNTITALEATISTLTQWRPMETAPRDGTRILVDFGQVGVHAVTWEDPDNREGVPGWCVDDLKFGPYALRRYMETDVKGWMPLPAAKES